MSLSGRDKDHKRVRTASYFFVAGVLLLLWVWVNAMCRSMPVAASELSRRIDAAEQGTPETAGLNSAADRQPPDRRRFAQRAALVLGTSLILILAFLIGSYAMLRASRRRRLATAHERPPPSAADDVWAMHRVPEYGPEEVQGEPENPDGPGR